VPWIVTFHTYMNALTAHMYCKKTEGVIWTKAKTCYFMHEMWNYSHVTSSNWTQPSFKLMLTL
jgi:hypothetical protein